MKKTLLVSLLLIACVGMNAETVKLNNLYYSLSYPNATVLKDQSSDQTVYTALTEVSIPATVTYDGKTYNVTAIGSSAFYGCNKLTSVSLPASIKSINSSAFKNCTSLVTINLPEGMTSIGSNAFEGCIMTSVTIPSTMTSIGAKAYYGCPVLSSVTWNAVNCSIETGSDAPFYNRSELITSFTFGNQVQKIPAYLCQYMSNLESVVIPASVTYIGSSVFSGCSKLKSVNIPDGITYVNNSLFYGCKALPSITLPQSITIINSSAFYGCEGLTSITLHEGITSLGSSAFYNSGLTSVTIPSTMTSIGAKAFYGCGALTKVVWNAINCSVESGSDAPFYNKAEVITSFTFGDQVQKVPGSLCQYMSVESIVIPSTVTSIGTSVFYGCSKLKSVNIPDGITYINNSLFYGCKALPSITLPQSITIINSSAFYGCEGLTSITLHEGITSLGSSAFYNSGLTSVTIPSTMTSIGAKAFYGCGALTKVVWNAINCSIETGSDAPFYNRSDLITSFTFGDQVQKIPAYLCQYMTNLESVVIPASVNYIGASTFYGCSKLKSVDLPEGITYVASSLFYGCSSLESVSIPKTVTSINSSAFYNCTKLASVSIPESATTIGDKAFYNCSNLQSIYNYAYTPQSINEDVVKNVNKQTCVLYVSRDAYDLYASKPVWCDFVNKVKMNTGLRFEDNYISFSYLEKDGEEMYGGVELVHMPIAPKIDNFVFEKWEVLAGDLADGVRLQAIYKEDQGTGAPAVYTNPANPAQKLIRRGNVYVLQDGKTYTVNGTRVE